MALYIYNTSCISPQLTCDVPDLNNLELDKDGILYIKEPSYKNIPMPVLRRMGKAVRLGVGTSLSLFQSDKKIDGIVIGTANGGMEDCIKFLNQLIEYNEGILTPTNFVNSTTNAIAGQIGFINKNNGYNISHVHQGLAFETALLDVLMLLNENPNHTYLFGGLDEISNYNLVIDKLNGCFREKYVSNKDLYIGNESGSIPGEGCAMFVAGTNSESAIGELLGVQMIHTNSVIDVISAFNSFLDIQKITPGEIGLFVSGENGDNRIFPFYNSIEGLLANQTTIVRYKHLCGEYLTASAFALWLCTKWNTMLQIPEHCIKRKGTNVNFTYKIIYNTNKGVQHSFMLYKTIQC